jgi:hypothetical protein
VDAVQILAAVQAAVPAVVSVRIGDLADASTWQFVVAGPIVNGKPTLVPADDKIRERAIAAVKTLLAPSRPTISKLDFLRLLAPTEYADVVAKARAGDFTLTYALALLDASFQLSPDEPTFIQMLAYCVSIGVFTPGRAGQIIAAMQPPTV